MKTTVIVLALCLFAGYTPSEAQQCPSPKKQEPQTEGQTTITVINGQTPEKHSQAADDKPPHWYKSPEWWLVIAGGLTLLGILVQAREMRKATGEMHSSTREVRRQADILERQTAATEKAASAAEKNIGIIISKERAWLTVKPKELNFAAIADLAYVAEIAINIDGLTRANVTEAKIGAYIRTVGMIASDIDAFLYPMASLPATILPNTSIPDQQAVFDKYSGADLSMGTAPEIRDGRLFVEMKGFINYRDAFGNERVTRFRYVWKRSLFGPAGWEKCGPTEDNQKT